MSILKNLRKDGLFYPNKTSEVMRMIKIIWFYTVAVLLICSCSPKDAMFNMMSNIKTHDAIYQDQFGLRDTISMGFKFHKPPVDLGSNKPFKVLTKSKNGDQMSYQLRNIQFDESAWMERVILLKGKTNFKSIVLTEHDGQINEFIVDGDTINVYKQTYNQGSNPKDNYSEFFTTAYGLIMISDTGTSKELVKYKGSAVPMSINKLMNAVKSDSMFYATDTISTFET